MTDNIPLPFDLPAVRRKKLTVDFTGGNQSSDAGLLLLRQAEKNTGVCARLAAAMPDARDPNVSIRRTPWGTWRDQAAAATCACAAFQFQGRSSSMRLAG